MKLFSPSTPSARQIGGACNYFLSTCSSSNMRTRSSVSRCDSENHRRNGLRASLSRASVIIRPSGPQAAYHHDTDR